MATLLFFIKSKRWDINNGGEISLRKNNIFAKDVKFSQGLQELLLTSAKNNNLQLELNDIILGDITKLFFRYPQLEGVTNGTVYLKISLIISSLVPKSILINLASTTNCLDGQI